MVNCGWNPLPIQSERAKRRLDCASRAERMRVITFCSTDWDSSCVLAKYLFDRRRFRAVVELSRAGVRVDVINLVRHQLRVGERLTHRANGGFAVWQRRRHMESIVV